jgi:hypothetical protein
MLSSHQFWLVHSDTINKEHFGCNNDIIFVIDNDFTTTKMLLLPLTMT